MKSKTRFPKRTSDEETEGSVLRIGTGLVYGGSDTHNPKCSLHHLRVVSNLEYGYPKIPY